MLETLSSLAILRHSPTPFPPTPQRSKPPPPRPRMTIMTIIPFTILLVSLELPTPLSFGRGAQPTVRNLVGCALCRASTQAQQNKALISGTRGAFRSGKRCATECGRLDPGRYWAAAAFAEQRPTENTVSVDTALIIIWQLHVVGSPQGYNSVFIAAVCTAAKQTTQIPSRASMHMMYLILHTPLPRSYDT